MRYTRRVVLKMLPPAALSLLVLPVLGRRADARGQERNFVAHLDNGPAMSAGEIISTPPTNGEGQAIFHLSADGKELSYKIIVANIENVRAAHIHMGPTGVKGPIVAGLYGFPVAIPILGRSDGILATGTIRAADLVDGLAGHALGDLIDLIPLGKAYVNVHTNQNPSGEIRGQIF